MMQQQTTHIGILLKADLERQAMVLLLNSFENCRVTIEVGSLAGFKSELTSNNFPDLFIVHYEHFSDCKETLEWITKSFADAPVIIISPFDADLVLIDLFICGACAFVKKRYFSAAIFESGSKCIE